MATAIRGQVDVKINGKERTLVFDTNTIAELEELFGRSPMAVMRDLGEVIASDPLSGKIFSVARALLWAGLHQRSPGLKIEAVGRAMVREELGDYIKACSSGLLAAWGMDPTTVEKKATTLAGAKAKIESGEKLTDDEAKAIEEAEKADPLAMTTMDPEKTPSHPSPTSEREPLDAV